MDSNQPFHFFLKEEKNYVNINEETICVDTAEEITDCIGQILNGKYNLTQDYKAKLLKTLRDKLELKKEEREDE